MLYTVVKGPIYLYAGTLQLTDAQCLPRKHCLSAIKGQRTALRKCYRIDAEVCFKTGEVIGYDGNVKAFSGRLQPIKEAGASE